MFYGSRKRRTRNEGASHASPLQRPEAADLRSPHWRRRRHATRNVTRASNEWLAADRLERAERYRRYAAALAEEEDAAAVLDLLVVGGAISVLNIRQNSLLVALGKTSDIFKGNLAATLFSASVGGFLVYQFGAEGAAVAASAALAVNYLIHFQVVRREMKLLSVGKS